MPRLVQGAAWPASLNLMIMVTLTTQVQRPEEVLVFARVISAQTVPEGVEGAIRISQEQLPDARSSPASGASTS